MRSDAEVRGTQSIVQISQLSDKEKELQFELRSTENFLREERDRGERYLAQVKITRVYAKPCL